MSNYVPAVIKDNRLNPAPAGATLVDNAGVTIGGDMLKATYDPTNVSGDAFNQDKMKDGTTNKNYTAVEQTKLAGIETGADVTDAFNVNAAGATMNADTDVSSNGWIVDEDDMVSNLATKVPTQQSVKAYCDALIGANDAMIFKGVIDCSSNPNYPAGNAGETYKVSVAGKIGGASGKTVEAGDMIICIVDGTSSGDEAAVGADWDAVQVNIDGAVTTTDTSSTDGRIIVESGTSGKVHVQSTKTITDLSVKKLVFTAKFYMDGVNAATNELIMDIALPYGGYILASSVKMQNTCTAGTIALKPTKNGVVLASTGLDLSIDSITNTIKDKKTVAYNTTNYDISAGDTVGFLLTSSSYTPAATVGTVILIIGTES